MFAACFTPADLDLSQGPQSATSTGVIQSSTGPGPNSRESTSAADDSASDGESCDPTSEPPIAESVFVSPTGDDAIGGGNPISPFASIARALERAIVESRTRIILDVGIYRENVEVNASHSGIAIEGGWVRDGVTWTRNCDAGVAESTVVVGVDASRPTLTVQGGAQLVALRSFTIATIDEAPASDADEAGASLTAVHVAGQETEITIDHAILRSGAASAGGTASTPADAIPTTCDGRSDCDDGAVGTLGTPAAPATPGIYDGAGYQPGRGQPGVNGSPGSNGAAGGPGESKECSFGCSPSLCQTNRETPTAPSGTCGCGGNGGRGGHSGQGGGASTALLVTGEQAKVAVRASHLESGAGGAGSLGSAPGTPADGSMGAQGETQFCQIQECRHQGDGDCVDGEPTFETYEGGAAGGAGGRGGGGSPGSGGPGGPSCPIAVIDPASVTLDEVDLVEGLPGAGAGGSPDGAASQCGAPR